MNFELSENVYNTHNHEKVMLPKMRRYVVVYCQKIKYIEVNHKNWLGGQKYEDMLWFGVR